MQHFTVPGSRSNNVTCNLVNSFNFGKWWLVIWLRLLPASSTHISCKDMTCCLLLDRRSLTSTKRTKCQILAGDAERAKIHASVFLQDIYLESHVERANTVTELTVNICRDSMCHRDIASKHLIFYNKAFDEWFQEAIKCIV